MPQSVVTIDWCRRLTFPLAVLSQRVIFGGMENRGRPTDFTDEIGDQICARLADDESLTSICLDENMPARVTVYGWLRRHKDFADNYARARIDQGHTAAEKMNELRIKVESGDLKPDAARVIMDALKWEAGKRASKYYGDKVALVGGDENDAPISVMKRVVVDPRTAIDED